MFYNSGDEQHWYLSTSVKVQMYSIQVHQFLSEEDHDGDDRKYEPDATTKDLFAVLSSKVAPSSSAQLDWPS